MGKNKKQKRKESKSASSFDDVVEELSDLAKRSGIKIVIPSAPERVAAPEVPRYVDGFFLMHHDLVEEVSTRTVTKHRSKEKRK